MDPQQTPHNLPFADDDAKLEAELADPTPMRPSAPPPVSPSAPRADEGMTYAPLMAPPPVVPAMSAPPMAPPRVLPPMGSAPSPVMPPAQAASPVVPEAPKKSADPEDIFSALETKRPLSSMNTVLPPSGPVASGSAMKYVLMAVGILVACAVIAGGIWYFAIHRSAQQAVSPDVLTPPAATDTIPVPPVSEPVVPPPAVPADNGTPAPAYIPPTPVTTIPNGTNVPPPVGISPETTTTLPATSPSSTTATSTTIQPGTDLSKQDSDGDGLTDVRENELGTNPAKADSDGDSLSDGDEVLKYRTNPLNPDSDSDTYPDGVEVKKGFNPLGTGTCAKPDCTL